MKKARRNKKTKSYFLYYLLVAIFLFAVSTAASYLYFKPMLAFEASFIENIEAQRLEAKPDKGSSESVRLYKSRQKGHSDNDKLRRGGLLFKAEDIIRGYMEPLNVKLLDLYMDRYGTIYVDLSSELRNNFKGDVSEEYLIIADLYKKMSINIPGFTSLKILIEGKETESFGGHIDISKPVEGNIAGDNQRSTNRYF